MTEPKPQVSFSGPGAPISREGRGALRLSARTRMLYDGALVFINGEALEARGTDRTLMHRLADERMLDAAAMARLSAAARRTVEQWIAFGWAEGC